MHIAYSAFSVTTKNERNIKKLPATNRKMRLRYKGYTTACEKYQIEIAAIQQYMPGWQPAFK